MAEMHVAIDGPVGTYATADPNLSGVYLYSIIDVPGSAALQNFYALYNPVNSGKTVIALGVTIESYDISTVMGAPSMRVFRTSSAPTGGTLISGGSINKFSTEFPNSVAQVFTGAFTATSVGSALIGFAPDEGAGSASPHSAGTTPGASFILRQGEGVFFQQPATGSSNQLWNIQMVWGER